MSLMTDVPAIKRFVTAGSATITLSSLKSGNRVTLKFKAVKDDAAKFFVSVLSGPDNENSYSYIGMWQDGGQLRTTNKSRLGTSTASAVQYTPSFKAAAFFCEKVLREGELPSQLEVRHEGRCGRCNRKLTTPESVDRGIGPECWEAMS